MGLEDCHYGRELKKLSESVLFAPTFSGETHPT
jgi:hypothetical protein